MINLPTLLADKPLPDPSTLSSPTSAQPDPLIDQGSQFAVSIGAVLLILGVAAAVGFFSRRVEHALITAFGLSLCLVLFWAFSR